MASGDISTVVTQSCVKPIEEDIIQNRWTARATATLETLS